MRKQHKVVATQPAERQDMSLLETSTKEPEHINKIKIQLEYEYKVGHCEEKHVGERLI